MSIAEILYKLSDGKKEFNVLWNMNEGFIQLQKGTLKENSSSTSDNPCYTFHCGHSYIDFRLMDVASVTISRNELNVQLLGSWCNKEFKGK